MMGFGMMGGGLFSIIIIAAIIYFIMKATDSGFHYHNGDYLRKNNALEILKEKYAKEVGS